MLSKEMREKYSVLTLKEVAELFGVSRFTVWRWVQSHELPARKIGKRWFVRMKDLDELFQQQQEEVKNDEA